MPVEISAADNLIGDAHGTRDRVDQLETSATQPAPILSDEQVTS